MGNGTCRLLFRGRKSRRSRDAFAVAARGDIISRRGAGIITELKSRSICDRALELGADMVGIAESSPLYEEAQDLDTWLKLGYHGTMAWMTHHRELRNDPSLLLPGCRSIVMIAVSYFTPHLHLRFPSFPKVSRYAWGRDYHVVLRRMLKKLQQSVDEGARSEGIDDAGYKIVVDSAPFRDKVWARRAGIGWIGKNSNLITRSHGSWVFLGGLLTTLQLDPTTKAPHEDYCGKCTSCMEACPTSAIVRPHELNARACLSYLTIEYDGPIPGQFRDNQCGWVFGCDTCQDVCPWNRFARPSRREQFDPKPKLLVPDLQLWSHMSEEEFEQLTAGTSLRRAGRERLRRNALAVMGLL